jgi:hypothetical protein
MRQLRLSRNLGSYGTASILKISVFSGDSNCINQVPRENGRYGMVVHGVGKPADCKLLRITAEIEGDLIRRIAIHGDFFAFPEEGFERVEARLGGTPMGQFEERFAALMAEEAVEGYGITASGVAEVLSIGVKNHGSSL